MFCNYHKRHQFSFILQILLDQWFRVINSLSPYGIYNSSKASWRKILKNTYLTVYNNAPALAKYRLYMSLLISILSTKDVEIHSTLKYKVDNQ